MAHATDIVAYTYKADLYCPDCIDEIAVEEIEEHGGHVRDHNPFDSIEALLNRWAARVKIYREDEASFDSGDFPKVVFRDMLDGDEHCGRCHIEIGD